MVAPNQRPTPFEMARDAIAAQIEKFPVGSFVAVPAHGVTCARVLGAMFTGTISELSSTSGVQLLVAVGPQTAALTPDMVVPVPDPGLGGIGAVILDMYSLGTPAQRAALREVREHSAELSRGGRFAFIQRPGEEYGSIVDAWAEDTIAVADLKAARTHVGTRTRIAEALLEAPAVVTFTRSGDAIEACRARPMPCERNPVWAARPRGGAWEVVERWGPQGASSIGFSVATETDALLCIAWRAASIWAKPDGTPKFVGKIAF